MEEQKAVIPWCCANCTLVASEFEENPRPCPRCGSVEFRRAALHIKLKTPGGVVAERAVKELTPAPPPVPLAFTVLILGPHVSSAVAGPTASDMRFLRMNGIGW